MEKRPVQADALAQSTPFCPVHHGEKDQSDLPYQPLWTAFKGTSILFVIQYDILPVGCQLQGLVFIIFHRLEPISSGFTPIFRPYDPLPCNSTFPTLNPRI